ncbi:MAG: glutaredoxin family protein [Bacteroidetes bacterium]|nr:glutaredoxin family protein [Bacteroidota bacterium]
MKQVFTLLFGLVCLTSCLSNSAQNAQKGSTISVLEFQKMMNAEKGIQLIDVRTPGEYAAGHLQNAINIDYNSGDFAAQIQKLDTLKKTMIYCLSGGRSASAMKLMNEKGFREVYNMQGGMLQWNASNLPLSTQTATDNTWKGMSKEKYDELISGNTPVLVDFNAKWCGPCKQLKPILEEIQKEYASKLKIVTIDIDENKSLAQMLYVRNIPLLIYHENGTPKINQEGFIGKDDLIKLLHLN